MSPRGQKSKATAGRKTRKDGWAGLTWDDLDRWAGPRSVARGRSYELQGRVGDLAVGDDGRLLATVRGGERYVVTVWFVGATKKSPTKIESQCTCPVRYDCKHAVATVAAYLQALADKTAVPKAAPDDPRWKKLARAEEEYDDDLDEWDDDEDSDDDSDEWGDDDEIEDEVEEAKAPPPRKERSRPRTAADWERKIREMVCGKSREELAELVLSLIGRFPELNEEFRERIALSEGDVKRLVGQARRELQAITSEPAWQNRWTDEGNTPDYSRLKHRLERLLELGHADAVVELGRELISSAVRQVEESHDEGETAMEVADCMTVVFNAVAKSSLPAPKKLLFAIDASLADHYDIVGESVGKILDAKWSTDDWSAVADKLAARLKAEGGRADDDAGDDFSRNYRRDNLTDWLTTALENAKRQGEIRAIYEAEAARTGSYERLVRFLIEQRQVDDAARWAREGIEKTRAKLPGIAGSLAQLLCDVAARRKRWDVVAAHAAVDFLDHPSQRGFEELMAKAKKAKCEEQVRKAALRFLETGDSPVKIVQSKKEGAAVRVDSSWPLPVPDYLAPLLADDSRVYRKTGPHYDVLLDMAITAKRPDDVLHWYDKMTAGQKDASLAWGRYGANAGAANRVAEAVAKSHPERALEIYRRGLDGALPHANMASYESATVYLRKMRPIMDALGRKQEWSDLLVGIREKYRNRPRFMELLDNLEGRTILAAKKVRRR
jgi:uncharacterized Zn finger protein